MPSAGLCDLIFEGGRIIDGLGGASHAGAVCVRDGRIVHVGPDDGGWTASDRIDLHGRSLAPGFIDCHTHDDQYLFVDPAMAPKVSQGVTTVVTGNCGVSLAPLLTQGVPPAPLTEIGRPGDFRFATFSDYLNALEASPPAVNAACLIGHTTLRAAVMGNTDRPANAAETARMEAMCESAMQAGAIGVSSGLFYPPAMPAPASEVIGLARIAARHGGVYTAHIRNEADKVLEGLEEAFLIAREAGAPLVISHHKVSGPANFGRSLETLRLIGRAATSQRVAFDVYPYAASSTMLNHASWSASRRTLVTWSDPHPEASGRELGEVAAAMGLSEEAALDALSPGGAVYFMMDEADVRRIIANPNAMIGSDGVPMNTRPHPRLWGAFTRVLGHYVRDVGLFPIEEAVRRMTSLPAQQFRLTDRGVIATGAAADLVIMDPANVGDRATFEAPNLPSEGIEAVFVAGICIWRAGAPTGARPGRVLRLTDADGGKPAHQTCAPEGHHHLA